MVVCAAVALTIGRIAHLLIRVVPGRAKFLGAVSAQFVVHAITIDGMELFESIEEWMDPVTRDSSTSIFRSLERISVRRLGVWVFC